MKLFKNNQNIYYLNILFYSELNISVCFGKLGTKKLLLPTRSFLYNYYNNIIYYISSFSYNSKFMTVVDFLIRDLLSFSSKGYASGFRLIGRGYKVYYDLNSFLFRLGYSHNIYYILPINLKSKKKEKNKNFWLIKGLSFREVTQSLDFVRSLRLADIYRVKGIYRQNDIYKIKSSKKGVLV